MSDSVNEIKQRLSIETLVSEYVVLKKFGKSLKGLCPFHAEKTPSFMVSPDKGIAYCFGCHKGGDLFKFFMEVENVDFSEALKLLAEKTGVTLEKISNKTFIKKDDKEVLFEVNELAAKIYEDQLWNSAKGKEALLYLKNRGLTEDTIKRFRIGYAPDSYEFTHELLLKRGFNHAQVLQAGLGVAKETSMNKIYDRFRNRVMFPVIDGLGRVAGYGGRALQQDQQPKYLNSPETPIYQKSQLLYGFYNAKADIKSKKSVIVVEGYMDFLMAFQDGVKNIVAVNGTALTKRHLSLLKSYIDEMVFCFDMDNAGKEAAKRSFELTEDFEFSVKVLELPSGKDIADFVLANPGKLVELSSKTKLFTDFIYEDLFRGVDKTGLTGKKKILNDFAAFFLRLKSSVEKDIYVRKLAADLEVPEVQIYDELNVLRLSKNHPAKQIAEENKLKVVYSPEELLLGLLVQFPKYVYDTKIDLSQAIFSERLKTVYKHFLSNYNAEEISQELSLLNLSGLDDQLKSQANLLAMYVEEKYGLLTEEQVVKEMFDLIKKVKVQNTNLVRQRLQKQLKEAEAKSDLAQIQSILMELTQLSKVN